jgi:hypothetical protein
MYTCTRADLRLAPAAELLVIRVKGCGCSTLLAAALALKYTRELGKPQ